MSSRIWISACIVLAVSLLSSPAPAAVPSPPNCTVEPVLVGDSNGMIILNGFVVTVRDIGNVPIGGSQVDLLFAGAPRSYTVQVAPSISLCPVASGIRQATNAVGVAVFQARFGGFANAPAILVRADGVNLANVPARSTDIDGNGATDIIDLALFRFNFLKNPVAQETDYDESGLTDFPDFNIFRQVYLHDVPGTPCP